MDTIFALASARGKAGISVVRISGPNSFSVLDKFGASLPKPRFASLRTLTFGDEVLDECLVTSFPRPRSFTGEDVLELGLHGSVATVSAVLSAMSTMEGFRLAEPGEFTRRALENEKLDLTQVEGLSDLIVSETEAQRRQALRVLSGALGRKTEVWRFDLIRAAALLEATIDFVDEDVPVDVLPEVLQLIQRTKSELSKEIEGAMVAERIRDGFEVAIVGRPNVGKSTLLNALAGREAAITSEAAGTTRDIIEVRMDLRGLPVTIIDTAGLRESGDFVERLGIARARERAESADLCVVLLESHDDVPPFVPRPGDILAVAKSDICRGDFSAVTGEGLDALVGQITSALEKRASLAGTATRHRHRVAITTADTSLGIAVDRIDASPEHVELIAEDLRSAIRAMDSLVGRVDVDHLLDEIFSNFCIGK